MRKIVLLTGAAGGIGTAAAELFLKNDWCVIAVDRNAPPPNLSATDGLLLDLARPEAIDEAFDHVTRRYGRLDAWVNNAAHLVPKAAAETSREEWDFTIAANVRPVFLGVRSARPLLAGSSGAIVNVASVHALATSPGLAAYAASKGALLALTRALALELAPDGIRVNAVLPGAIDTAMLREGLGRSPQGERAALADLVKRHPLGRIGRPDDIAHMILFLADRERAPFITGQAFVVDGGALCRLSTE
jgi:NAD(P)-dependent dehydrogenase (short-subunit alcohol dehydrogenase family)